MAGSILKAVNVSKSFHKSGAEIPVLQDCSLSIAEAEMVAVTGASGVGKSTLLHILGTLEPPTRGEVFYGPDQVNLNRLSARALSEFRNKTLGFIFQFHYLLPEFSALENVMMPALIAGHGREPARAQAAQLLEFVGLAHRMTHRPSELSGGEQQRVAVARSVILRPKVLLADELTGNLDSKNGQRIMDLLIQLNQATGVAILLVTHDEVLAKKMHRNVHMQDGRMVHH